MACYQPLTAYLARGGGITFKRDESFGIEQKLPCGQCVGCRLEKSRQWAIRCVHEASLYPEESNSFITLTYAPEHLPKNGSLNKKHFQDFMKRLRKKHVPKNPYNKITQKIEYDSFAIENNIRFYHCGEYGEKLKRPHYHAILFNHKWLDKKFYKEINKTPLFTSKELTKIWGKGHASFGNVTFESAAYVARYIMKKVNGEQQAEHYQNIDLDTGEVIQLQPEYTTMSRKPGIAKRWYDKYKNDVFPSDEIILLSNNQAKKLQPPSYYMKIYQTEEPELYEELKIKRKQGLKKHKKNSTKERLAIREKIHELKLRKLIRHQGNQL